MSAESNFQSQADGVRTLWDGPALKLLARGEARLALFFGREGGTAGRLIYEFIRFGVKQAVACIFGGSMVALLILTYLFYPKGAALARNDFLFLAALSLQILFLALRFETWREAGVILVFHVVGTAMELFKTSVGAWTYLGDAFFHIGAVPLFTGFMYSAIGSYMMRAWSLFDFRFTHHPPLWRLGLLAAAIYANFFLHHYFVDLRPLLFAACLAIFWRSRIYYRVHHSWRWMPMLLAALLCALFIYLAENVGTLTSAWLYPGQAGHWRPVGLGKLGSWFLLQIVSYALVAAAVGPRPPDDGPLRELEARHAARLAQAAASEKE